MNLVQTLRGAAAPKPVLVVAALLGAVCFGEAPAHGQRFPFGKQHQPYQPGTLTPDHFTRAQLNAHAAAYYDHWKQLWIKPDPAGEGWHVLHDPSGKSVSEGNGYGMVVVATMAGHDRRAREIFDGLWRFRLAHPSENDDRLMDWNVPDKMQGNGSALDGDLDIAYGLLMAHAQWGSDGEVNYLEEAKRVISGIRERCIGPQSKLPMLGDWVRPDGERHNQWTVRSSDFMLGHFDAFGRAADDVKFWTSVSEASERVAADIQANESAATGLLPDFIVHAGAPHDPRPAPPRFLEKEYDGDYWFNAGRVPWRLGAHVVLNSDPAALAMVRKLSRWARTHTGGDANKISQGYHLDGSPLTPDDASHFFVAPFAVAAMTGSGPADQKWLNDLYSHVYERHEPSSYYADAVTLQSLLIVTGNFWDPTRVLGGNGKGGTDSHAEK